MDRGVVATAGGLCALGLLLFAWKVWGLGMPVLPERDQGVWKVQLDVSVRGQGTDASVRTALPDDGPGQQIFGEHFASDRMTLDVREGDPERDRESAARVAVWTGFIEDLHQVLYVFHAKLLPIEQPLPGPPYARPSRALREAHTRATIAVPAHATEIRETLKSLDLPSPEDLGGRIRAIYAYVLHEIAAEPTAGPDPLLALAQRAGNADGRERLLAAMLRGSGIPTRLVRALALREPDPRAMRFCEVYVNGAWVPISASEGFFGAVPENTLVVAVDEGPIVQTAGVRSAAHTWTALREPLSRDELVSLMEPPEPLLRAVSLHRVSVPMQRGLRILLVLCVATLVVSALRNLVGIRSFGTFMPVLLALALVATGLWQGLALIVSVLAIGIGGRLVLERLRLLLVPRLGILLCVVVLCVAAFGLLGRAAERPAFELGIVFPIVILTMLVERFSIVMVEEGGAEALRRAASTCLIALAAYPVFLVPGLGEVLLGYPELILVVMGIHVAIGGYTGYRLSDLVRFRGLQAQSEAS